MHGMLDIRVCHSQSHSVYVKRFRSTGMEKKDKLSTPWSDLLLSLIEGKRDEPSQDKKVKETFTEESSSSCKCPPVESTDIPTSSSWSCVDLPITNSTDVHLLKPEAVSSGLTELSSPSEPEGTCLAFPLNFKSLPSPSEPEGTCLAPPLNFKSLSPQSEPEGTYLSPPLNFKSLSSLPEQERTCLAPPLNVKSLTSPSVPEGTYLAPPLNFKSLSPPPEPEVPYLGLPLNFKSLSPTSEEEVPYLGPPMNFKSLSPLSEPEKKYYVPPMNFKSLSPPSEPEEAYLVPPMNFKSEPTMPAKTNQASTFMPNNATLPPIVRLLITPPRKQTKHRPRPLKLRSSCSQGKSTTLPLDLGSVSKPLKSRHLESSFTDNPDSGGIIEKIPVPGLAMWLTFDKTPESSPKSELTTDPVDNDFDPVSSDWECNNHDKVEVNKTDTAENTNPCHLGTVDKTSRENSKIGFEEKLFGVLNFATGFEDNDSVFNSDEDIDAEEPQSLHDAVQRLMKSVDLYVGDTGNEHSQSFDESCRDSLENVLEPEGSHLGSDSKIIHSLQDVQELTSDGPERTAEQIKCFDELAFDGPEMTVKSIEFICSSKLTFDGLERTDEQIESTTELTFDKSERTAEQNKPTTELTFEGPDRTAGENESAAELTTEFDSLCLYVVPSSRRRRRVNDDELVSRIGCIFQEFDLNYDLTPRCEKSLDEKDEMFGAVEQTTQGMFHATNDLIVLQVTTSLYRLESGYLQYDIPVF